MKPPWGTVDSAVPGNEQPRDYTVNGLHLANGQRWTQVIHAPSARAAEDLAMHEVGLDGDPRVTGVFYAEGGRVIQADIYAFYLDPDEPAHAEEEATGQA